jgi:CheY-like chemotaxis protein
MTVVVPLARSVPEAHSSAFSDQPVSDEGISAHILLIEDDEMGRVALAGLLESWGYPVRAVESAKMAAEQFQARPLPDIIISDFRLGGGTNGIEAIHMLRTLSGREIAACLISGDTSMEVQQLVKSSGLTLLSKPVRPGKLRSLLRHLSLKDAVAP